MDAMGKEQTEEQLAKMIKKYDLDHDGKIDYDEFCVMMGWKTEDEVRAAHDA